ncbi:MAG: efflux RND transporter periplasmic adaptor subunit, partial [Rhizomicrobium sp.]
IKATRFAELLKASAIAPQDNDNAQSAYLQAKANLETTRINLAYTRITAPISGRIGASTVTIGALVTANQANSLATISTLDPIYVDIDQSSSELLALERAAQKGQIDRGGPLSAEVTLTLDDGSVYPLKGKLQFTDVTVDPTTGTVRLRAIFPNPDGYLLPGLYVRATINEGVDPHGILIPQLAVGRNPKGEPTVLVVDDQNTARLKLIKTGRVVDGNWQVLDGLKAGEKVIVQGLQNLRPDMKVTPMPAQTGPAPAAQSGTK